VEVIVVSSFDMVYICGALAVDGIGYAGWLAYLIMSTIVVEAVRVLNSDIFDAKGVIPYLPLLEHGRAYRMGNSTMGLTPWSHWLRR